MNTREIEQGSFVLMSCGTFNRQKILCIFRALMDFYPDVAHDEYLHDILHFDEEEYCNWLVDNGILEKVICIHHIQ